MVLKRPSNLVARDGESAVKGDIGVNKSNSASAEKRMLAGDAEGVVGIAANKVFNIPQSVRQRFGI